MQQLVRSHLRWHADSASRIPAVLLWHIYFNKSAVSSFTLLNISNLTRRPQTAVLLLVFCRLSVVGPLEAGVITWSLILRTVELDSTTLFYFVHTVFQLPKLAHFIVPYLVSLVDGPLQSVCSSFLIKSIDQTGTPAAVALQLFWGPGATSVFSPRGSCCSY